MDISQKQDKEKNNNKLLLRQFYEIYESHHNNNNERQLHVEHQTYENKQLLGKDKVNDGQEEGSKNGDKYKQVEGFQIKQRESEVEQQQSQQQQQQQQNDEDSQQNGQDQGEDDSEQFNEDRQKLYKTMSTQIMESKVGNWQQATTLRQIEQKSERQQNSNSNSREKQLPTQKANSKRYVKQHSRHQLYNIAKAPTNISANPKLKSKPTKSNNKAKSSKLKKSSSQLIVSLNYGQSPSRTYHIGMKILNKEWNSMLNSIHLKQKQQQKQ